MTTLAPRTDRRAFLTGLVAGISLLAGQYLRRTLAALGLEAARPRPLVRAYLAHGGSRARAAAFLAHAHDELLRRGGTLTQWLAERRSSDFQTGNTLVLDGWIVAESEILFVAGLDLAGTPSR